MFYYISFLRPPPHQISPSANIKLTPQIANDLRTELCPNVQDIYYSWIPHVSDNIPAVSGIPAISKPEKLTTWRDTTAYREISISAPPRVREGQAYRLVLTSHSQGHPHVVNLASEEVGARPLPVISMPILFSSKGKGALVTGKQEKVERLYRILTSPTEQVFLKVTEQTSFDLDKKIWDSGIGLSSWLTTVVSYGQRHQDALVEELRTVLRHDSCQIIELGAGTGIVSLVLGALRSNLGGADSGGCVITTDLESAMPLLEHNISTNDSLYQSAAVRPQAKVLNWDMEEDAKSVSAITNGFDLIVMADVTYNTASFPSLVRTLDKLFTLSRDHNKTPILLLGYKERDSAERSLWGLVTGIGVDLAKVYEKLGAGGAPVEIWIGKYDKKTLG